MTTDPRPAPSPVLSPALSIVAPCFDEAAGLAAFHERASDAARGTVGASYEIVLVNDGSRDETWEVIQSLCDADPHVVGIDLSRNHGHQLALTAGLSACRGGRVLIIDADLQDPPELLGAMWTKADEGADVVYGRRTARAGETWFKRATASLFYRTLRKLTATDIPADTGDFRLMSRRAVDTLASMPERFRFVRGMVAWIGLPQAEVPYERDARHAGETGYGLAKMLGLALDAVTGFSIVPLRLAVGASVVTGAAGLVALAATIGAHLAGSTLPGWTSIACLVLVMGSLQLAVLGVMSEYLGRMYVEAKGRPLFVVREVIRSNAQAAADGPARTMQDALHERIKVALNG